MFLNESRARKAEKCLRMYYWEYIHGGQGLALNRTDRKLVWGQLMHAGLAAHYSEQSIRPALALALQDAFPQHLNYAEHNEWMDEIDWIEKVLGRYVQWAATRDNFTVLGVEQSGSVILGEACWRCGKSYDGYGKSSEGHFACLACGAKVHNFIYRLDLLVRDDYGVRVIDHKSTAAGVDEFYLRSWEHSSQMWGYCYGAEKLSGLPIAGYDVNIVRKVNSAGEEPDLTKCCPDCKNGKIKVLSCETCARTGRVARAARPADQPFHRESFSFTPAKRQWFVEARVKIATKLTEHQDRFDMGDPSAFPRNPSACFSCAFTDLCYQRPGLPLADTYVPEERYTAKGPDYVTLKRLALEEGK